MSITTSSAGLSVHDASKCLLFDTRAIDGNVTLTCRGALIDPGLNINGRFTKQELADLYRFLGDYFTAHPLP